MTQLATVPAGALSLRDHITDIPDFPKPGILFRDISPILRHHFGETIAQMNALYSAEEWAQIDVIAGIESRGFILASGMAAMLGKGFVKIRKPGKLPGAIVKKSYKLEYGVDALEMQPGYGRMLIVDDVLATGGTLGAAAALATEAGYTIKGFACLVDLAFLNHFSWNDFKVRSVITYDN